MKKKISLISLVLVLILSLAGCGSKANDTEYDKASMESYAGAIIQNFSAMTEEDLDSFADMSDLQLGIMLLQSGFPVEGDAFLSMIDAWKAGVAECGELEEIGDYEMKTSNSGATLTADAVFSDRDGEISFAFDEKMNMESLTVNATYSMGEILKKAGLNTILGMGTVFVVLIFIAFIISLFKYIPAIQEKFGKKGKEAEAASAAKATAPAAAPAVKAAAEASAEAEMEIAAVIAAAIAAAEEEKEQSAADGFMARSIKRRKSNRWN